MNDDPLDLNSLVSKPTKRSKASGKIESDLVKSGLTKSTVSGAKGDKLVKGRKRKTIFLPPDLIDKVDAAANDEGASLMDFYHWMLAEAWRLYESGDIEPAMTEVVRVVRGLEIEGYTTDEAS